MASFPVPADLLADWTMMLKSKDLYFCSGVGTLQHKISHQAEFTFAFELGTKLFFVGCKGIAYSWTHCNELPSRLLYMTAIAWCATKSSLRSSSAQSSSFHSFTQRDNFNCWHHKICIPCLKRSNMKCSFIEFVCVTKRTICLLKQWPALPVLLLVER